MLVEQPRALGFLAFHGATSQRFSCLLAVENNLEQHIAPFWLPREAQVWSAPELGPTGPNLFSLDFPPKQNILLR